MKKSILSLAVMAFFFTGCNEKKSSKHSQDSEGNHTNTESVHEHEDGSVHEDHHDAEHHQEEFTVESDSSTMKTKKDYGHSHEDDTHKH